MEDSFRRNEADIIWESCGYCPLFAIPLKSHHYILYRDSILVTCGHSPKTTISIKLHSILIKEMIISPLAKMFSCGKIRLITKGYNTPAIEMLVKNPEELFYLIEKTQDEDHKQFVAMRAHYLEENKRGNKRKGIKQDASYDET